MDAHKLEKKLKEMNLTEKENLNFEMLNELIKKIEKLSWRP